MKESEKVKYRANRRNFLKNAALTGAAAATLSVRPPDSRSIPPGPSVDASRMPTIALGERTISRLILGANPQWGYSHRGRLMSDIMTHWYTSDRVVEVLHHAERCGINTWQSSVSGHFVEDWKRYREEGGRMNLILLVHSARPEWKEVRSKILPLKPLALVHHGGATDRFWRDGNLTQVEDEVKSYHDDGVLAGCSSHLPQVITELADRDLEVDFYMTCFYQISLSPSDWEKSHGFLPLHEMYTSDMPTEMTKVIRKVDRPCLGFKILAAGRACDRGEGTAQAFQFAFKNIKPSDGIIVGMFPYLTDQVAENSNHTIRYGQNAEG